MQLVQLFQGRHIGARQCVMFLTEGLELRCQDANHGSPTAPDSQLVFRQFNIVLSSKHENQQRSLLGSHPVN